MRFIRRNDYLCFFSFTSAAEIQYSVGAKVADRPTLHRQLMFLPTVVGTVLFVIAALEVSEIMEFIGTFSLLLVTAIPFQYTYTSLFPIEPRHLREVRLVPSILLFSGQVLFWVGLFVIASHWGSTHGT